YNAFGPGAPGFPARGRTYVDPVFGTEVRRLTDEYPGTSGSQLYAKNGFWNADGSRLLHFRSDGSGLILDTATGSVLPGSLPGGMNYDASFSPHDPDLLYFFDGRDLRSYSLRTDRTAKVKNFPARLSGLGASVDWIDRTGRYMLLAVGDMLRVWDRES